MLRTNAFSLAVSAILAGPFAYPRHAVAAESVMPEPIVTVTTHLAQHASEFFEQNPQIDQETYIRVDGTGGYFDDWGIFDFLAHASRPSEPQGYVLRYKDGDCEISLPAGRAVAFDYQAGFFTLLTSTLPLEPLPFDEIMVLAKEIGDSFERAGWSRIKYKDGITQERFGAYSLGGKLETLGRWAPCDNPALYADIIVKSFNNLPAGPDIPPAPGRKLPDDYPDRYIIQVDIGPKTDAEGGALDDEAYALRDARRLAVNGDKSKELTLKNWIDDPDWRPEGWRGKHIE